MVRTGSWLGGLAAMVALLSGASAPSHPIHTTYTEVLQSAPAGTVTIRIRGFQDDLEAVAQSPSARGDPDSAVVQYLRRQLVLFTSRGQPVALRPRELRRAGDVLWLTLESAPVDLRGGTIRNAALTELHDDQVNLIRISWPGKSRTLLFTAGDGRKPLGR